VLVWLAIAVLLALALYAAAPWLLPVRIYEGPLVQATGPGTATLVWYTTRAATCTVDLPPESAAELAPSAVQGTRHEVRLERLSDEGSVPYTIRTGDRALTDGLALRPARAPGERFTFLVFGDSGNGSRAQYQLAETMLRSEPAADFLLHTGDVVYSDGARHRYEEHFFAPYRRLIARIPFWPCLGNHDIAEDGTALPYREVFVVPENGPPGLTPEHNYWFDYADARFVVIDSNMKEETLRERVAPWADAVLAAAPGLWRFVALHHPPYTGGKYAPDLAVQRALVPTFERQHVDIVFCGHDHMYQRMVPLRGGQRHPEGVHYVITAAGGGRLYEPKPPRPEYVAALDHEHHSFTQVVITGPQLTLRQITTDGAVIDELRLTKPAPQAPLTESAPASRSTPVN
jgi:3',5'-cyclic AMP phosphodiesterase CpdA